jgi:hypothetical protein
MTRSCLLTVLIWVAAFWVNSALAQVPPALAARGETAIVTYHAEGAQIYECKADGDGKLSWVFREPIATLLLGGKTVGRHYTGPTWELTDGSAVTAQGACDQAGAFATVAYSADYNFLSKEDQDYTPAIPRPLQRQ